MILGEVGIALLKRKNSLQWLKEEKEFADLLGGGDNCFSEFDNVKSFKNTSGFDWRCTQFKN